MQGAPGHPGQSYCFRPECRGKRKARWRKLKVASDAHYRLNQKTSREERVKRSPGDWKRDRKEQKKPE